MFPSLKLRKNPKAEAPSDYIDVPKNFKDIWLEEISVTPSYICTLL